MATKFPSTALTLVRRRQEPDPTLPAILEYQWPSTAIVNAPIPRSARGMIWLLASLVVAMIVASGLIPIDRVVTARGVVVATAATILVQPLDTSIVRSIDVREGQEVKAGQLLARLDPTFATADFATMTGQVSSLEAEVARLQAESRNEPFDYAGTDPAWKLQASLFGHRKAQFAARMDNFAHKQDELDSQLARAQSDARAYRERLGVAQNVEQMRRTLEEKQVGTKLNTLIAQDNRAEMGRALAGTEQSAVTVGQEKQALEAEREGFIRGWRADVAQQLSTASEKAGNAREQLNKAGRRQQLAEFRAEQDATVQSLARVSVGSVLQSGQQFITLAPHGAPLEVEANVSGGESGFVHPGDAVAIKFDTFPYSQYGMAEGEVKIVSPNSFTSDDEARNPTGKVPKRTGPELFYRARINITRVGLHGLPHGFHVISGMPVTADIKVGKRTVLQYMLGVMLPVANEAMREP